MLESLGSEELLLVLGLGLLLFSPAEIASAYRRFMIWQATARSWAYGMWHGLFE